MARSGVLLSIAVVLLLLLLGMVVLRPDGEGTEDGEARRRAVNGGEAGSEGVNSSRENRHERVAASWERFRAARRAAFPRLDEEKGGGASEGEIRELERELGVKLPGEFREFLKIVDGGGDEEPDFYEGSSLLDTARIVELTEVMREAAEMVEIPPANPERVSMDDIWHPNLVIVSDLAGGGLAIDWKTGEVWDWDHDGGMFGIVAPSWNALLVAMAESIEEGRAEFQDVLFYNIPRVDENGEVLVW